MKKKLPWRIAFTTLLCNWLLVACVSYDAEPFIGKTLPRPTGYSTGVTEDWIYFNLRTGQQFNTSAPNKDITEGEQKDRIDWDLAFCGYRLRTNSGTSGVGKGGAADLQDNNYGRWTKVSELPEDLKWTIDNDNEVYVTMSRNDWNKYLIKNNLDFKENPWFDPNSGPAQTLVSANPTLAHVMSFSGPPPIYSLSYHVYVIRTADGKRYFKLQVVSWYNTGANIGDTGGMISYYCDELINN